MDNLQPLQCSKSFRYKLGHVARQTCTVGELRDFLAQLPADMPVLAEWEGTHHGLSHPRIKQNYHWGCEDDKADALIFDAEMA